MKTRCKRCRKLIEYGNSLCEECIKKVRKASRALDKEIEATTKNSRWKAVRADIIRRDGGCCVLCYKRGIIEYKTLQVHHIVKRKDNPDLIYEHSNLVTVCRPCHEEIEKYAPAVQREMLGEFNKEEEFSIL